MKIEFRINEEDFLIHQLFLASKAKTIRRKRWRSKLMIPLLYFIIGLLSLYLDKITFGVILFFLGFLWFFIYPKWERHYYIKHYKSYIKENYKERIGRIVTFEINDNYILSKDDVSESKVLTTEIDEIFELSPIISIQLKSGFSFILSKQNITDIDKVKSRLYDLAKHLEIKYNHQENWEWR